MGTAVTTPPAGDGRAAALAPAPAAVGACRHCGLAAPAGDPYCCYGCEIAARIGAEGAEEQGRVRAAMTLSLLLSMVVMMISLLLFAEDVYDVAPGAELAWLGRVYRVLAALLSTPVILMLGIPLVRRAARALAGGRLSMDLLVATGAAAAYGLSIHAVIAGRRGVYFDSATSALLLTTLGRYLEAAGRARASKLLGPSLKRSTEPVLVRDGDHYTPRAPALIEPGDRLRIEVEEVLPVDAEVTGAPVEVNLGVLTGESAPVTRAPGEQVPAGAVPVSGAMECTALRSARESTLERLARLSASLRDRPARLQRWADAFAAALAPIVIALAIATFARHALGGAADAVDRAVVVSLAVVLAACPCTYGATIPLVFWLTLRKALEHGVLIRTAEGIEQIAGVETVAFDKTGTLTERELSVIGVELESGATRAEVLSLVAAMEAGSRHPVAAALRGLAEAEGAAPAPIASRELLPGRGVTARDPAGGELALGSPRWLAECGIPVGEGGPAPGASRVVLARGGRVLARFRVGEAVRSEAREAIDMLAEQGIDSLILTGDADAGAAAVAAPLGLRANAGLSAEDKVARLAALGRRAAMVGDGLNDAPALAGAGPSFAMEGGTDLARGMAQVSLLRPDLRLVPWTIGLARRALTLSRRSLFAATAYNLIFLALAATGALLPVWAGLSMATSSILMLASALRISAYPPPPGAPADAIVPDVAGATAPDPAGAIEPRPAGAAEAPA